MVLLRSVWFKISINTLKPSIITKQLKVLWCFYTGPKRWKPAKLYAKQLLQIFVLEMSCFKSHMFSALFVLKGGTVFDIKATRAQTIVLLGGKGDIFLFFCSEGLYSVFLGQDFPVTLSTALKYVTV